MIVCIVHLPWFTNFLYFSFIYCIIKFELLGVAILSLGENSVENILDNKLLKDLSKLSGVCMKNASEFFVMRQELTRSQGFLELARHVSDNPSSIGFTVLKMLVRIVTNILLFQCAYYL